MSQPTREEFDALKEEVRQIREQQTEPIRFTDNVLLQTLVTMAGTQATDVGKLKGDMQEVKQAIANLESKMEKRLDAIASIQKLILERLPPKNS